MAAKLCDLCGKEADPEVEVSLGSLLLGCCTLSQQQQQPLRPWPCLSVLPTNLQDCWNVICIGPHDEDFYHEKCIQKFMSE